MASYGFLWLPMAASCYATMMQCHAFNFNSFCELCTKSEIPNVLLVFLLLQRMVLAQLLHLVYVHVSHI